MAALGAIVILAGWAVIRAAGHRPGRAAAPAAQGLARAGLPLAIGILVLLGRSSLDGRPNTGEAGATGLARAGIQATGRRAATVVSVGSPKAAEQIALIDLEAGTVAESGAVAGGTGASWSVEALLPRYPEIGPGDRILVSGTVAPPGDDDYGAYLRQIGAAGTLRSPTLERLAGPAGPAGILDGIREGSADALARALPEPQAGLASGILVGLRDRVDRDLAAAFTQAGVSHIVAISGWNIAIVAALIGALLRGVGPRRRTVASLVAIAGYTLVAGASPSVDRAALMAAIGLTARATGRSGSALAGLGWAVLVLLLLEPTTVLDPGFELSGLATAGLIAWTGPLTERIGGTAVAGRPLPGWLAESLAISIAAQAATLPIVLLTFGRLAIVAPLANLVIVPIVPPAMAAGAVALGAGWLGLAGAPQALVTLLGLPAWAALGLMIWLVRTAAALPLASVTLAPPWNVAAAAISATLILAVGGRRMRLSTAPRSVAPGRPR